MMAKDGKDDKGGEFNFDAAIVDGRADMALDINLSALQFSIPMATVSEAVNLMLRQRFGSERTRETYRSVCGRLLDYMREQGIKYVTRENFEKSLLGLTSGRAYRTRNVTLSAFRRVDKLFAAAPQSKWPGLAQHLTVGNFNSERERPARPLTDREEKRFFSLCWRLSSGGADGDKKNEGVIYNRRRDGFIGELMLVAPLRRAEVALLKVGDIHPPANNPLGQWTAAIRGKGGGGQVNFHSLLPGGFAKRLRNFALIGRNADDFLFVKARGFKRSAPLLPETVSMIIRKLFQQAEIKDARSGGVGKLTPHSLRHTFAHRMKDSGASLPKIKGALNHQTEATTEKYLNSHFGDGGRLEQERRTAERFEKVSGEDGGIFDDLAQTDASAVPKPKPSEFGSGGGESIFSD